jgi:hypothetical protein
MLDQILGALDKPRQSIWNFAEGMGNLLTGRGSANDVLISIPGMLGAFGTGALAATGFGLPAALLGGSAIGGGLQSLPFAREAATGADIMNNLGIDPDSTAGFLGGIGTQIAGDPLTWLGGTAIRGLSRSLGGSASSLDDLARSSRVSKPMGLAQDPIESSMATRAAEASERSTPSASRTTVLDPVRLDRVSPERTPIMSGEYRFAGTPYPQPERLARSLGNIDITPPQIPMPPGFVAAEETLSRLPNPRLSFPSAADEAAFDAQVARSRMAAPDFNPYARLANTNMTGAEMFAAEQAAFARPELLDQIAFALERGILEKVPISMSQLPTMGFGAAPARVADFIPSFPNATPIFPNPVADVSYTLGFANPVAKNWKQAVTAKTSPFNFADDEAASALFNSTQPEMAAARFDSMLRSMLGRDVGELAASANRGAVSNIDNLVRDGVITEREAMGMGGALAGPPRMNVNPLLLEQPPLQQLSGAIPEGFNISGLEDALAMGAISPRIASGLDDAGQLANRVAFGGFEPPSRTMLNWMERLGIDPRLQTRLPESYMRKLTAKKTGSFGSPEDYRSMLDQLGTNFDIDSLISQLLSSGSVRPEQIQNLMRFF